CDGSDHRPALRPPHRDGQRAARVHSRHHARPRLLKDFSSMDFSLSPELQALKEKTRAFIRESIVPLEGDKRQTRHGPTDAFRRELNALAAREGLLTPHVSAEFGGLGLTHVGKAIVFEEAGYSLLGPLAMNISA